MDSAKITQLAQLLRDSGDKVLNDRYKLTLSDQLLQTLSAAFRVILDDADDAELVGGGGASPKSGSYHIAGDTARDFQVVSRYHNARTPEMTDLQLIYDFVQKTRILCVTKFATQQPKQQHQHQPPIDDSSPVDITKFRNLRRLEIRKLAVSRVRGIQRLRGHLQELKCADQAIESVEEIIVHCGGDRSTGFAWNALHTVDFSYNRLRTVDGSLEFVTALQHLDLSHNHIVSADAVKWLKNLKYLNLSFNRLAFVPTLHVDAPRRLKVLVLANNMIKDMQGLSRLDALCELDLSDNFLLDHSVLMPLGTLIALQMLNLSGNPLACHPKHRQTTAQHLHPNTTSGRFSLNGELLSKHEKSLCQQPPSTPNPVRQSFFSFARRSQTSASMTSSRLTIATDNTPASSVGSLRSYRLDDSVMSTSSMGGGGGGSQKSLDNSLVYRRGRPKTAAIAERPPGTELATAAETATATSTCTAAAATSPPAPSPPPLKFDANTEHLEVRKQIEEMREMHGVSWLLKQSHDDRLGATTASDNGNVAADTAATFSSTPVGTNQMQLHVSSKAATPIRNANGAETSETSAYETDLDRNGDFSDRSRSDHECDPEAKSIATLRPNVVDPLADIFPSSAADDLQPEHSDVEEGAVIYIVTLQPSLADLFLVVSETTIRERDALTGETLNKWSMSLLESCDRTRSDVLRLNFDTLNRERRERIYRVETGLCQQLERYLRGILAQRPLSAMNQVQYRCVKCGLSFTLETGQLGKKAASKTSRTETKCPTCGCTFLVEVNEPAEPAVPVAPVTLPNELSQTPTATRSDIEPVAEAMGRLEGSASQSSIGSAHSLNGSSDSPRPSNASSLDSDNASIADRLRRVVAATADDRCSLESDVEILSNPSQSSIEVLGSECTSAASRKQSADDRPYGDYAGLQVYPTTMALSLDAVADQINRLRVDAAEATEATQPTTTLMPRQHQQTSTRDLVELVNSCEQQTAAVAAAAAAAAATHRVQQRTPAADATAPQSLAQLTESSSSGSVTDSICTKYDQQHRTVTTHSNASSIIAGDGQLRTPEKTPATGGADASMITSMLGGLFQSTNSLMAGKLRSGNNDSATTAVVTASTPTTNPFKFSYMDFEAVDHRLKLYLYQTLFEDDNEQLKWLARGQVLLNRQVGVSGRWLGGAALFVMSTTKFYVLQIVGPESDDISKWVRRQLSGTIDRLHTVRVLPWKIGLTFDIKGIGTLQLLLQDILRTDSLLLFLANNPLPDTCTLHYQPAATLVQQLLATTGSAPLKMLAILAECSCSILDASATDKEQQQQQQQQPPQLMPGLIVTETHLYLLEPVQRWLSGTPAAAAADDLQAVDALAASAPLRTVQQQLMNNLVAAERLAEQCVRLTYLEEVHDRQEEWTCTFETADNASSTLNAVGQSWERLFGVPLSQAL